MAQFINYGLIKTYLESWTKNLSGDFVIALNMFQNDEVKSEAMTETVTRIKRRLPDSQEHIEIIASMLKAPTPKDHWSMKFYTENLRLYDPELQKGKFAMPSFRDLNEKRNSEDTDIEQAFDDATRLLNLAYPRLDYNAINAEVGTYMELLVFMGTTHHRILKLPPPSEGDRFNMMLAIAWMVCRLQNGTIATPPASESPMNDQQSKMIRLGIEDETMMQ